MKSKDKASLLKSGESAAIRDLIEKNNLIQELMDQTPDVIYFKDRKGRLILVNQAHAKGLGLAPQEVVGKTDFNIFGRRRAEQMAKDDRYVMSIGKPIIDKIERSTRADGVDNYVSTTKIPRFDSKGRVIGLIGITRDITHRMQLETISMERDRLKKKLEALRELDRIKSEFISIASHELRTPLAIIKEAIQIVLDGIKGPVNDGQRDMLFKSEKNIERLNKIIEELLDMSRIERGKIKLRYSLVNFKEVIRDTEEHHLKLAVEKGIKLNYKLPKEEINIFVDPARVIQVMSNLLNNAVKFTETGGSVDVEVRIFDEKIRIGVIDTGIGIAKRDLQRIFQKFVQIAKNKAGVKNKGIGLGLSIIKELVAKHGGEIWAESQLGVGSKFYFTLPRFYALGVMHKDFREKINNLLEKNVSLYLIDILILNYKDFKKSLVLEHKMFLSGLEKIIKNILEKYLHKHKRGERAVVSDFSRGESNIILPGVTDKQVIKICTLIKEQVNRFFGEHKMENTFVNIGIMHFSHKKRPSKAKLPLKIEIKKILIGINKRHHLRVPYYGPIEQIDKEGKIEVAEAVDISSGGICFVSHKKFETDSLLIVKLKLDNKHVLSLRGRVAWIKELGEDIVKERKRYKIGYEFINLTTKQKHAIMRFIKTANKQF